MKLNFKLLAVVIMCFSTVVGHARTRVNMVTLNVGGTFNYAQWSPNVGTDQFQKDNTRKYIGGGFNVELGNLSLGGTKTLHGTDTRLSFGMNFDPIYKIGDNSVNLAKGNKMDFNSLFVYISTTYVVGTILNEGRFLVDLFGFNLGYLTGELSSKVSVSGQKVTTVSKVGSHFLVGVNLPLGIQYIFKNGFILGFRHRLDFAFSTSPEIGSPKTEGDKITVPMNRGGIFGTRDSQFYYMSYNLTFSIGYAFGGK